MYRFFSCRGAAVAVLVFCAPWSFSTPADAETIPLDGETIEYASLTGRVYVDLNGSGEPDAGEGLIPNVAILLAGITDASEPFSATTWTNEYGVYLFEHLLPGVYSVTETQPVQFLQGKPTSSPSLLGGGSALDSDRYVGIVLSPGAAAASYDFGEGGLRSAYLSKRYLLAYQPKPPASIPEPAAALALATGMAAILAMRGRRRDG